jgi:hypothetical protein
MAIKPILFNAEMVRAILDMRKSCTRRLVRFLPGKNPQWTGYIRNGLMLYNGRNEPCIKRAPYQPGDILYVRETWRVGAWDIFNQMIAFDYKDGTCGELTYIHDRELFDRLVNQSRNDARQAKCEYNGADFVWEKGKSPCRWHPSIHMPKEAARIWLKVTDVRVERLQEITSEQIGREGVEVEYPHVLNGEEKRYAFSTLWNSTIKKSDLDRYGWNASPWVWVIKFERCEKPEGV